MDSLNYKKRRLFLAALGFAVWLAATARPAGPLFDRLCRAALPLFALPGGR